jgi:hypothetical protein
MIPEESYPDTSNNRTSVMRRTRPNKLLVTLATVFSILLLGNITQGGSLANRISAYASAEDPVITWNKLTTQLSLENKLSPPRLARAYALVQISIYDALLSSKDLGGRSTQDVERAVAAGAASEVLNYLFPGNATQTSDVLSSQITPAGRQNATESGAPSNGLRFGQMVGKQVVIYAKKDGSDAKFTGSIPTGDCKWTGTNPVEPMAGQWKTFILTSATEIQPPPPKPCNSEEYKAQVRQLVDASHNRTAEQIRLIHYWGDSPPPAIWNNILNERIESHNLSIVDAARASAYLNIGMYDAGVSTWYAKFKYWTERPFQAVPGLITEIPTPNFPAYTSGHSTFSGAASTILGDLFPNEKGYFSSLADEANMSRMWGGLHLLQDCNEGLAMGTKIGSKIVQDMHRTAHTLIYSP